jgi:glycosyltransferase involved in cell wall biosynthesis
MIKWLNLKKYSKKVRSVICIVNSTFFNKFDVEISYEKRQNIIGYVGALTINKGVLNLIKIVPILKIKLNEKLPKFIIIGDGPLLDDLKTEINESEIMKNVTFIGYLPYNVLHYYYNKMRILVLPSYTEGLPSVILEAMACGTPVLATPVGAIPDIIKEGETGFLLKTNEPKQMAEKIIEILDKHEVLEKVSAKAYKYVKENFSYEKTLEDWRKILSEL